MLDRAAVEQADRTAYRCRAKPAPPHERTLAESKHTLLRLVFLSAATRQPPPAPWRASAPVTRCARRLAHSRTPDAASAPRAGLALHESRQASCHASCFPPIRPTGIMTHSLRALELAASQPTKTRPLRPSVQVFLRARARET